MQTATWQSQLEWFGLAGAIVVESAVQQHCMQSIGCLPTKLTLEGLVLCKTMVADGWSQDPAS